MTRPSAFSLTAAEPAIEPMALRPREAARALGISERLLWDWARTEGLPHLRIGNVVLYPVAALRTWLADRVAAASQAAIASADSDSTATQTSV